ncbi:MAG: flagellar cap protein FliD N-terminal domain-containing protein, partial [Oscillospiraceae bacterium]
MNVGSSTTSSNKPSSGKGFSGMASGIDTDAMVEAMLSGTQSKIDKQNVLLKQTTARQKMYRSIIENMNTF